jgi:hypothetical protein
MKKDKMPDREFWEEYLAGRRAAGGCALLGKTAFDKLEAVKGCLSEHGLKESDAAVVDCREIRDADAIMDAARRYHDTPYVIFDSCEDVLCRNDVLKVFAHLLDADEYDIWFPTESFYVFLGDRNTIPRREDYPAGSWEEDHIASFCSRVGCYDFDAGKRFMGHGVKVSD